MCQVCWLGWLLEYCSFSKSNTSEQITVRHPAALTGDLEAYSLAILRKNVPSRSTGTQESGFANPTLSLGLTADQKLESSGKNTERTHFMRSYSVLVKVFDHTVHTMMKTHTVRSFIWQKSRGDGVKRINVAVASG